jgi:hypothetical protein
LPFSSYSPFTEFALPTSAAANTKANKNVSRVQSAPEDTQENEDVLHTCEYDKKILRDNHCEGLGIEEAMRNVPLYRKIRLRVSINITFNGKMWTRNAAIRLRFVITGSDLQFHNEGRIICNATLHNYLIGWNANRRFYFGHRSGIVKTLKAHRPFWRE